jgi:DNA repair exonuclease SbcCD ATPase subunit
MHKFQNYIDLRQNVGRQTTDISLWPSFTDIMTVILMIFMLTMIVVIIKNSNLAQQLIIREKRVKQIEQGLAESKRAQAELRIFITNLEEKLRAKEMGIILLGDEKKVMQSSLEAKLAIISALKSEMGDLEENVLRLEEEIEAKDAETVKLKRDSEEKITELTEETKRQIAEITEKTRRQIEEFNRKFEALMSQLSKKEEIIVILDADKKELGLTLAKQRQAYSFLEEKYHKLIRPARSPLDKQVVTVHYSRKDGAYRILFKDLGAAEFKTVEVQQMHARLGQLKTEWQDKLYVKIIIPEDSGLSYNEAWSFTKDILSRYDYYYQEKED